MPDHNKSPRSPGLLSKIKNIFGLNIGTIIFGVLLLYMIFSMIVYLTSDTVESVSYTHLSADSGNLCACFL